MANYPPVEYISASKTKSSSKKQNNLPDTTYAVNMRDQYQKNSQIGPDFVSKVAAV